MKFNLIEEPWILLLDYRGAEAAYGLRDAFYNMDRFLSLGGEIRLQDTAMLRLFSALAVTMIYRYDEEGRPSPLKTPKEAMERFSRIWSSGTFPAAMSEAYFKEWHDRFYLIGGDYPFYQIPLSKRRVNVLNEGKKTEETRIELPSPKGLVMMNEKNVAAINGTVLESGNKESPFACSFGDGKDTLFFGEAARWLVFYMAYADCGTKAPGKWASQMTFTSAGVTVYPIGHNLFETVLLNTVLLDEAGQLYPSLSPAWEREPSAVVQANPYGDSAPQNLPELYTQQSRRMILKEKEDRVISVYIIAGDKYSSVNARKEPMFLWVTDKKDKTGMTQNPLKFSAASSWMNLQQVLSAMETHGCGRWMKRLEDIGLLEDENIPFLMTGITYKSMQSSIDQMLFDQVIVNPLFFEDTLKTDDMKALIDDINGLSKAFYLFGQNLERASGGEGGALKIHGKKLELRFQSKAEGLFRRHLINDLDKEAVRRKILDEVYKIEDDALDEVPLLAFILGGRQSKEGEVINAAAAERIFRSQIWKITKDWFESSET